jgi:hypothetical protein
MEEWMFTTMFEIDETEHWKNASACATDKVAGSAKDRVNCSYGTVLSARVG